MATRFLPLSEILDRVPVCRETLRTMIAKQEFPAPVRVSPNRVMWPEDAFEQWAQSRTASGGEN